MTPPPTGFIDPITAKIQAEAPVDSTAKCPIRYLDQHSPEEVAQYFENHKHEIPRSHEICVKRYQTNTESIRQLDAKYGSLVNMIQGLGVKHKPLLPTEDHERVENWAEKLSHDEEDREGHFERPLKEIRVGESPSRPWGISVPIDTPQAEKPGSQCPFDASGKAMPPGHPKVNQEQKDTSTPAYINPQLSGMIFTGPVFIGYSQEQAAGLLKSMDLANRVP
jgi:hypothetical protein